MHVAAHKSTGTKTNTVIAEATDRLLSATKKKMLRKKGRIDYDKLAQNGFSAAMIERLKTLRLHSPVAHRF